MTFESTGRTSCPNCGTQLTELEISSIQNGSIVKCRGCSYIISSEGAYPGGTSDGSMVRDPYSTSTAPGQWTQQRGTKPTTIFFIGLVILSLGLYSWIFYIPLFSEFYFGELIGGIAVLIGLRGIWSQASDKSGAWFIIGGLLLYIVGWLSWLVYIPIFSDFFFGEIGGLVLIFLGYQKVR
ncbi:MAG: hypothetical protein ACFFF4_07235 [Candidatus Thorarchaeota archaeon]